MTHFFNRVIFGGLLLMRLWVPQGFSDARCPGRWWCLIFRSPTSVVFNAPNAHAGCPPPGWICNGPCSCRASPPGGPFRKPGLRCPEPRMPSDPGRAGVSGACICASVLPLAPGAYNAEVIPEVYAQLLQMQNPMLDATSAVLSCAMSRTRLG